MPILKEVMVWVLVTQNVNGTQKIVLIVILEKYGESKHLNTRIIT